MIYYVSEKCSGKVLNNERLKHAKPVWNGWEGLQRIDLKLRSVALL